VSLDIRPAGPDDVGVVVDILAESSAWLRTKGITQWPEHFPRDLVMLTAERGELYVAVSGDEITATATLQWSDPAFWGEREDAGFLHRLAVRRRDAGIGRAMIEWAQQQVVAHRRAYLCLDCLSSNARLRRYYEDLGFHRVGEINGPFDHPHSAAHGAWRATLYEKMVGCA